MTAFVFFLGLVAGSVAFVRTHEVNGWPVWRAIITAVFFCWATIAVGLTIGGLL